MRRAPGSVIATVALAVALGGSAIAADGLPGKNSVRSEDIVNGQVKRPDLGADAVTRKAFRRGSIADGDVRVLDTASATLVDANPDDFLSTHGEPIIGRPGLTLFPLCTRDGANVSAGLALATDPDVFYEYTSFRDDGGAAGSGGGGGSAGMSGVGGTTKTIQGFSFVILTNQLGGTSNRLVGDAMLTVHGDQAECEVIVNVQG